MAIVGVTGLPGSGKSYVCEILNEKSNFTVIDADKIGHELLKKKKVIDFISEHFPTALIDEEINRAVLGKLVFSDSKTYHLYNDFISVEMKIKIVELMFDLLHTTENIVLDAALIFEWNLETIIDVLIYCKADDKKRYSMIKKRGHNVEEYKKREMVLIDEELKIDQSDIVIENNYDDTFLKKVQELEKKIMEHN